MVWFKSKLQKLSYEIRAYYGKLDFYIVVSRGGF
jgi:hypothetical protein